MEKENIEQKTRVSHLLISHGTLLSHEIDTQSYIDHAITVALTYRHDRSSAYDTISLYLKENSIEKKYNALLERLSILIESAQPEEYLSLAMMIQALANSAENDQIAQWNKTISKIVNVCVNMVKSKKKTSMNRTLFAYSILVVLLQSKIRSTLSQFNKILKDSILVHLSTNELKLDQFVLLAEAYALICSIESTEFWSASFQNICKNYMYILDHLLSSNVAHGLDMKDEFWVYSLDLLKHYQGVNKALFIQQLLNKLLLILQKMLLYGNSTGFIALDLTYFLTITKFMLPYAFTYNTKDSANFIENNQHLSLIDIAFVITQIKISLLNCLTTILQLNLSSYLCYGYSLLQPVFSLLNKTETLRVPKLMEACLDCLSIAVTILPNTVVQIITSGSDLLQQLLDEFIQDITIDRSVIISTTTNTSTSTTNKNAYLQISKKRKLEDELDLNGYNDQITIKLFHFFTELLSFCGPFLSTLFRKDIERCVYKGLKCLTKGLLHYQYEDRRIKRHIGERLRHSTKLQLSFLQLSIAEIISASKTGITSANVSLVIESAKLFIHVSRYNAELAHIAQQGLLIAGQMMHPSAIPIPTRSPEDLASDYLLQQAKQKKQQEILQVSLGDSLTTPVSTANVVPLANSMQEFSQASKPSAFDTTKQQETEKISETKSSLPTLNWNRSAQENTSTKKTTAEEEDDGDLPDIVMDSDPEEEED